MWGGGQGGLGKGGGSWAKKGVDGVKVVGSKVPILSPFSLF